MGPNRGLIDRQTGGQSQVKIWILINQEPSTIFYQFDIYFEFGLYFSDYFQKYGS